jgi:hypothetical protein
MISGKAGGRGDGTAATSRGPRANIWWGDLFGVRQNVRYTDLWASVTWPFQDWGGLGNERHGR